MHRSDLRCQSILARVSISASKGEAQCSHGPSVLACLVSAASSPRSIIIGGSAPSCSRPAFIWTEWPALRAAGSRLRLLLSSAYRMRSPRSAPLGSAPALQLAVSRQLCSSPSALP
eukprot:9393506-Pyramimonas_sp.AAC.2